MVIKSLSREEEKRFRKWTQGLNPLEARISIYNHIRDIPYGILPDRHSKNAPTKMLIRNRGSCTAKHILLGKMFNKLNIKMRYSTSLFRFSDLKVKYPNDLNEMVSQLPIFDHFFCQAFIGRKWISIDATWDSPLKKAGFPITDMWDGFSDTLEGVKPLKRIITSSIENKKRLKKKLISTYTPSERQIQPKFFRRFNQWLNSLRH